MLKSFHADFTQKGDILGKAVFETGILHGRTAVFNDKGLAFELADMGNASISTGPIAALEAFLGGFRSLHGNVSISGKIALDG